MIAHRTLRTGVPQIQQIIDHLRVQSLDGKPFDLDGFTAHVDDLVLDTNARSFELSIPWKEPQCLKNRDTPLPSKS